MSDGEIFSFEVTKGGKSGDLISEKSKEGDLAVGFIGSGYFEYWRMYEGLRERVEADLQTIADRLGNRCRVIYPGLIDTLDKADAAGRLFRESSIDVLVVAEATYSTDYLIHQALLHLPDDMPILLFASQKHAKLDYKMGYDESLRNSGPMGIIQLACGFRKMDKYRNFEAVVGSIDDDETYEDIYRYIKIREIIKSLRFWNIGLIGHIFRGMYDFQYDKTSVSGKLGPHIMDVDIKHLKNILDEIELDDPRVKEIVDHAKAEYVITDLDDIDLQRGARLGVAFQDLVERYKLDGLALLGQHFIEVEANTTCYLGLSELLSSGKALAVTEGDVLGLIMSKVLKELSGTTPFFGEWEEIDAELNAIVILGHGFIDPRTSRPDRPVKLQRACEDWGFEGNAPGFEATYSPGPVTMSHIIEHQGVWKLLVSEGTVPDTPPLEIGESSLIIKTEKPIREYYRELILLGFSHHAIVAPGHHGKALELFGNQLDIEIIRV
ncbi:MAG: hypothetical protein HN368_11610 [Spirochaetales bacterium]|jgi:L-arabinose isomerase|nr:hypothetical protein [Spirochaetales bacterium]